MLRRIAPLVLVACGPLVEAGESDEGVVATLSGDPQPDPQTEPEPEPDPPPLPGDADVDDGGGDDSTGAEIPCVAPTASDVIAVVWPGQDPATAEAELIELEVDCTIEQRLDDVVPTTITMSCADARGPLADLVTVGLTAQVQIPAQLEAGAVVHARLTTWRDHGFPRGLDSFALSQDGVLLLGASSGVGMPGPTEGATYLFFSPIELATWATGCPAPLSPECHDFTESVLSVTWGEAQASVSPHSFAQVGGYDVHAGALESGDSPQCGEPHTGTIAFAIAPTP